MRVLDWTAAAVMDAICAYHIREEAWPSLKAFEQDALLFEPTLPSKAIIHRLFGGIRNAVHAAAVRAQEAAQYRAEVTQDLVRAALPEATPPLPLPAGEGTIPPETVRPVVSGKLTPREDPITVGTAQQNGRRGRQQKWTVTRIEDAYLQWHARTGDWPTGSDLTYGKGLPHRQIVLRVFGGLEKARAAAQARLETPSSALPETLPVPVEQARQTPQPVEAVRTSQTSIVHCGAAHPVIELPFRCPSCRRLILSEYEDGQPPCFGEQVTDEMAHLTSDIAKLEYLITTCQAFMQAARDKLAALERYEDAVVCMPPVCTMDRLLVETHDVWTRLS